MAESFDSDAFNGSRVTETEEDNKEDPSQSSLSLTMASQQGGGEVESTIQGKQEPFLALSAGEGIEASVASCNLDVAVLDLELASSGCDEMMQSVVGWIR